MTRTTAAKRWHAELFHRLLQAPTELVEGDERATLESISNHLGVSAPQPTRNLL